MSDDEQAPPQIECVGGCGATLVLQEWRCEDCGKPAEPEPDVSLGLTCMEAAEVAAALQHYSDTLGEHPRSKADVVRVFGRLDEMMFGKFGGSDVTKDLEGE